MGAIGPWQIVIILILALLLFGGGGKISSLMGDFAKGIKSFRKGLQEDEEDKSLTDQAEQAVDVTPATTPATTPAKDKSGDQSA